MSIGGFPEWQQENCAGHRGDNEDADDDDDDDELMMFILAHHKF